MRKFLLGFTALCLLGVGYGIAQNYTVTQGSGTTFGSKVVATVNYAQQLLCDATTPAQCVGVSAGGLASVAATQTGTWTVQPGNTANTTAWLVSLPAASTATVTSTSSSAVSVQVLAANAARKGLVLTNTDANVVYVKFGTTASPTSFTIRMPALSNWEMSPNTAYTGRIDAVWTAAGSGALIATEM
jgi:hypothetical protein